MDIGKIKAVKGTMDGNGYRGRPNKEWTDDIKDWCKQDFAQDDDDDTSVQKLRTTLMQLTYKST